MVRTVTEVAMAFKGTGMLEDSVGGLLRQVART